MIFQHTWQAVLDGRKTQTRRIVKPNSAIVNRDGVIHEVVDGSISRRTPTYAVGKTYAVQPGRGQKAVARIRILGIRREDVRDISAADVQAEGFESREMFFKVWCEMHDSEVLNHPMEWVMENAFLWLRPAKRYDAWALTFEVVK